MSSSQPLELLVEKSIGTYERPMEVGEAFRRVLECIASGILLEGLSSLQLHTGGGGGGGKGGGGGGGGRG